jgi:hypothetical protein
VADTVIVVEQDDVRFEITVPASLADLTDQITVRSSDFKVTPSIR